MDAPRGSIVIMGSGELTSTMVEVHKGLIARLTPPTRAVFIDTPAGFQLNADQISEKAVAYFADRIQHPMTVASLKSPDTGDYERGQAYQSLRRADYVLMGPGSPTYTVRVLGHSQVPEILVQRVFGGACLVAASAAALTIGRFTLPVYEIYKVGDPLRWIDGLNILDAFGLGLTVVPHWNNAEGGTHDTRYCYMGKSRFDRLLARLPDDRAVLGLDEHTACIIDFGTGNARINGLGRAVLLRDGKKQTFSKGDTIPLGILRGETPLEGNPSQKASASTIQESSSAGFQDGFWDRIHRLEADFQKGLDTGAPKIAVNALLEIDRLVWQAHQDLESEEFIAQAREKLRDMLVMVGQWTETPADTPTACLTPLVQGLVDLRKRFRENGQWTEADALRDLLSGAGIVIEDTPDGPRWRSKDKGDQNDGNRQGREP